MKRVEFHPGWEVDRTGKIFKDGKRFKNIGIFGNGYPMFSIPGVKKPFYVHRLVAQAFIPNPNNYPHVLHIKRDLTNVHVSNLKWGTQKENMQDRFRDGTHLRRNFSIDELNEIYMLLETKMTQHEIAKRFNTMQSTISHLKTGHTHASARFQYRFKKAIVNQIKKNT
jgi:hypothetical protein